MWPAITSLLSISLASSTPGDGEVSLMAQEIILIFFVVKSAQTAKELF